MRVDYHITANGKDITAIIQKRLLSMRISDEAGEKSDTAELVLSNIDSQIAIPERGATLKIALGFQGNLTTMGSYVVDEVGGDIAPATLNITARAANMLSSIRAPKSRQWQDVSIGTIVNKIAGDHGLKPQISKTLKTHHYDYIAQSNESDLNFLTRLAKNLDAIAKPAAGQLLFVDHSGRTASGQTIPTIKIDRNQMQNGSWRIEGRKNYGSAVAAWRELATARLHKVKVGDKEPVLQIKKRFDSQNAAKAAAKAALAKAARGGTIISINLAGFWGDLTAGATVDLRDIQPELAGQWLISRVDHNLNTVLQTSFEARRN